MKNVLMGLVVLAVGSLAFGLTGDGTESSPYLIYTQADLEAINTYLPAANVHFKLMQDIALTGTYSQAVIAPDGDTELVFAGQTFQGTFDGDGKKITGLKIVGNSYYVGLFGYARHATITNLELEDVGVAGDYYVGGLAGYAVYSVIDNCTVTKSVGGVSKVTGGAQEIVGGLLGGTWSSQVRNCQSHADVDGVGRVGGLIGHCSVDSAVDNCVATGKIHASDHAAGGLIGRALRTKGITNSYATGDVTAVRIRAGGLIGWNNETRIVSNCHATGDVSAGERAGGLIGDNRDGVTVVDCYATGKVTGTDAEAQYGFAAGLLGVNYYSTVYNSYATGHVECYGRGGGLVGTNNGGMIVNCRAEGNVTLYGLTIGDDYGGGLVGRNHQSAIHNSYATGTVTGVACTGGLVGDTVGGEITRSYATGNVTGQGRVGGLVGDASNAVISNSYATGNVDAFYDVGGLIGSTSNSSVIHCYASGVPTSSFTAAGALFGHFDGTPSVLVIDCFWDSTTSGIAEDFKGGEPKTTAEMQDPDTFIDAGWGFFDEPEVGSSEYWVVPAAGEYMKLYVHSPLYDPFEGDGTADSPYAIYTQLDLERVHYDLAAHYILMNDIDLAGTTYEGPVIVTAFTPMGAVAGASFAGVFDGNDKIIENLTIMGGDYSGLFGAFGLGGVIKDLGVEAVNIVGGNSTGGLVGFVTLGTISNCYTTGQVVGAQRVGGLVGDADGLDNIGALISGCHSTAAVTGTTRVGGLVGNTDYGVSIVDSHATGQTNGTGAYTGGLVGRHIRGSVIDNCHAAGNVISTANQVGGLVGDSFSAIIRNSHATGDVTGVQHVAGLVGNLRNADDEISNSYATGKVTGTNRLGGLVGYMTNGNIANSYATGDVFDIASSDGVGGLVGFQVEGSIEKCYATGNVHGRNLSIGGLVGNKGANGVLRNSYATGNVSGRNTSTNALTGRIIGGLVGRQYTMIENCYATGDVDGLNEAGGLVGRSQGGSVTHYCYATGAVSGAVETTGGVIGNAYDTSVWVGCFWDTETSGLAVGAGNAEAWETANGYPIPLTGLTTAEMKVIAPFAADGWNFAEIWFICEGFSYPKLFWQDFADADINLDGAVDIDDLELLAAYWLDDTVATLCVDIYEDGVVDLQDFAVLAAEWMVE